MKQKTSLFLSGYRKYHLEIRHLIILFLILLISQLIVLYFNQHSAQSVLVKTQQWYQQDTAEWIANLTTTTFELLMEAKGREKNLSEADERKIIQDFNIIFSQQLLHQNVQAVCILVSQGRDVIAIDDGHQLYSYLFTDGLQNEQTVSEHRDAIALYETIRDKMVQTEQTQSILEGQQTFHVFIPFVPRGEFLGAVYMKNTPDLLFISEEMSANFRETALAYSGVIVIGLLAMFFVSSRTLQERDEAQQMLFEEQKSHLTEQIHHQKEIAFTKRIYHTHHKAEKISGFIKEDLRRLTPDTIDSIKYRIEKFANFIARVIYDMKWYDPPINTIRGPLFRTNINAVIRFLTENVFVRRPNSRTAVFSLDLDPSMPEVAINEYVIWEVLEPLIQNSLDHGGVGELVVTIETKHNAEDRISTLTIADNGVGIQAELLARGSSGVKKIFEEHSSFGEKTEGRHSGYGCYIAYEIATQRCGWKLDAMTSPDGGSKFIITLQHDA